MCSLPGNQLITDHSIFSLFASPFLMLSVLLALKQAALGCNLVLRYARVIYADQVDQLITDG